MTARLVYNDMMIIVFWLERADDLGGPVMVPRYVAFEATQMLEALKECEVLRKREDTSHVCIQSELPNCVGKPGVDDSPVPAGYTWYKRRIDPSIPFGRERT